MKLPPTPLLTVQSERVDAHVDSLTIRCDARALSAFVATALVERMGATGIELVRIDLWTVCSPRCVSSGWIRGKTRVKALQRAVPYILTDIHKIIAEYLARRCTLTGTTASFRSIATR